MPYMVTFTINIPQMLPYMAYMDPMGYGFCSPTFTYRKTRHHLDSQVYHGEKNTPPSNGTATRSSWPPAPERSCARAAYDSIRRI